MEITKTLRLPVFQLLQNPKKNQRRRFGIFYALTWHVPADQMSAGFSSLDGLEFGLLGNRCPGLYEGITRMANFFLHFGFPLPNNPPTAVTWAV